MKKCIAITLLFCTLLSLFGCEKSKNEISAVSKANSTNKSFVNPIIYTDGNFPRLELLGTYTKWNDDSWSKYDTAQGYLGEGKNNYYGSCAFTYKTDKTDLLEIAKESITTPESICTPMLCDSWQNKNDYKYVFALRYDDKTFPKPSYEHIYYFLDKGKVLEQHTWTKAIEILIPETTYKMYLPFGFTTNIENWIEKDYEIPLYQFTFQNSLYSSFGIYLAKPITTFDTVIKEAQNYNILVTQQKEIPVIDDVINMLQLNYESKDESGIYTDNEYVFFDEKNTYHIDFWQYKEKDNPRQFVCNAAFISSIHH